MKAKHHFWSSLAADGAVYWATGSVAALGGAMIGGFLIDADHLIDQWWSISYGAPIRGERKVNSDTANHTQSHGWVIKLLRPRKLLRLPLVFHSYELLAAIMVVVLILRTPFLIGLSIGYVLHIALDVTRHHREFLSPLFYFFLFRLTHGFRRDRLIKSEYL